MKNKYGYTLKEWRKLSKQEKDNIKKNYKPNNSSIFPKLDSSNIFKSGKKTVAEILKINPDTTSKEWKSYSPDVKSYYNENVRNKKFRYTEYKKHIEELSKKLNKKMTKNDVTYQVYENLFLNDPTFQQLSNDDKKETLTKLKQFIITGDASLKTETYRSVENKKMEKLLKTDKATIQKEMKRIMSELNDITGEFNNPKKGFETEYQNLIKRWKELNNTLKSL